MRPSTEERRQSCLRTVYETRWCRAERFEQERGALLARVDACEVQRKDAHALDRENWRLIAEVRELQQVAAPAASLVQHPGPRLTACHVHARLPPDAAGRGLQALSEAQAYIFEERDRLLALKAENENLHRQELQDRRRIEHLLALTDRGRRVSRPSGPATHVGVGRGAGMP